MVGTLLNIYSMTLLCIAQHLHHDICLTKLHHKTITSLAIGDSATRRAVDIDCGVGKWRTLAIGDNTRKGCTAWWLGSR